jgi:hypothetical protein|nr:MAG TPA: hypothetical protein [Caudoviricetes sp.]
MRGFDIKQIRMRSFQISGLTAKWGIGKNRVPPIWDNNLIGRRDARTFPDGDLDMIPNTATMEGKAPDLTVMGATMKVGTLQFDGVGDYAETAAFAFPDRFTVFWDIDWLGGGGYKAAGIVHPSDLYVHNAAKSGKLDCYIKSSKGGDYTPNTNVGLSTNGNIYAPDGSVTPFGGTVGTNTSSNPVFIARVGANFTQMGFRQLLIFNKELSQAEVNDVLRTMFPA